MSGIVDWEGNGSAIDHKRSGNGSSSLRGAGGQTVRSLGATKREARRRRGNSRRCAEG